MIRSSACPLSYWNLLVRPASVTLLYSGSPSPTTAYPCGSHITTITSPARARALSSFPPAVSVTLPRSESELTMCVRSSPTDWHESQSEWASRFAFPSRFGQGRFKSSLKRGSACRVTIALLWRQLPFMARLHRKRCVLRCGHGCSHIKRQACNWFPQTCHWTLVGPNHILKTWHSAGKESVLPRPLYEGPARAASACSSGPLETLTCSFHYQINFNIIFPQPGLASFLFTWGDENVSWIFPFISYAVPFSFCFFVNIRSLAPSV